jgi:atypical dual specificity phosphatase
MEHCLHQITKLTPKLYLSAATAITEENLAQTGINLIVNATKELPMYSNSSNIHTIRVPVYDSVDSNLYPYFKVGLLKMYTILYCLIKNMFFQPICELIETNDGSTLIHCLVGRSRSASLCIAYLLSKDTSNSSKCRLFPILEDVQLKRQIVQPNQAFMGQLIRWEDEIRFNKEVKKTLTTDKEKSAINDIYDMIKKI